MRLDSSLSRTHSYQPAGCHWLSLVDTVMEQPFLLCFVVAEVECNQLSAWQLGHRSRVPRSPCSQISISVAFCTRDTRAANGILIPSSLGSSSDLGVSPVGAPWQLTAIFGHVHINILGPGIFSSNCSVHIDNYFLFVCLHFMRLSCYIIRSHQKET